MLVSIYKGGIIWNCDRADLENRIGPTGKRHVQGPETYFTAAYNWVTSIAFEAIILS
jgi:hypothetical protein